VASRAIKGCIIVLKLIEQHVILLLFSVVF